MGAVIVSVWNRDTGARCTRPRPVDQEAGSALLLEAMRTPRGKRPRAGVPKSKVHMASSSRKGPWRICQTETVRFALTNQWLAEQGVISVSDQRYIVSQRVKATL